MSEDLEKILTRAKKLLAKAESAREIGSLHEAEAFAEGAAKLLAKHKLDAALLSDFELNQTEPISELKVDWRVEGMKHRRKRVAWMEWLAHSVARGYFCRILVVKRSSSIYFVGRKSDAEVARYVMVQLVRAAEQLAEEGYWKARYRATKETGTWNTRGYKTAFFHGFVSAIDTRLKNLRQQQTGLSQQMALVYVKSDKEITQYMDDKYKKNVNGVKGRSSANAQGYRDGHQAGLSAQYNTHGVATGAANSTKSLKA